jgi:hypothetical protein
MFKSVLYAVCILGTFLYGMSLAEWKAVYYQSENPAQGRKRTYGYFAQLGVGLPALFAYAQYRRYNQPENEPSGKLDAPLEDAFVGTLILQTPDGQLSEQKVSGRIALEPLDGGFDVHGNFVGTKEGGEPVELKLKAPFTLQRRLGASPQRKLTCYVLDEGRDVEVGELTGAIPRAFWEWFAVPLEKDEVESLSGRLGKKYELALVFTWIAGLLNVLAVWDAFEGPAYGYGDEDDEEPDRGSPDKQRKDDKVAV